MRIGVISDTHGLLRPEAVEALQGIEHILHAGDVGDMKIIGALEAIAPLTVVRGNVDHGPQLGNLPLFETVTLGGKDFYMRHVREQVDLDPVAGGFAAVIFGHTHRPTVETVDGVLWLNPGSIGPVRFDLPISMAMLTIEDGKLEPEFITLSNTR